MPFVIKLYCMKTTKIAIDGTSALAQGGGIGRFTQGLLLGLAQVDAPRKRGDETSYILGYTRDVAHKPRFELPRKPRAAICLE